MKSHHHHHHHKDGPAKQQHAQRVVPQQGGSVVPNFIIPNHRQSSTVGASRFVNHSASISSFTTSGCGGGESSYNTDQNNAINNTNTNKHHNEVVSFLTPSNREPGYRNVRKTLLYGLDDDRKNKKEVVRRGNNHHHHKRRGENSIGAASAPSKMISSSAVVTTNSTASASSSMEDNNNLNTTKDGGTAAAEGRKDNTNYWNTTESNNKNKRQRRMRHSAASVAQSREELKLNFTRSVAFSHQQQLSSSSSSRDDIASSLPLRSRGGEEEGNRSSSSSSGSGTDGTGEEDGYNGSVSSYDETGISETNQHGPSSPSSPFFGQHQRQLQQISKQRNQHNKKSSSKYSSSEISDFASSYSSSSSSDSPDSMMYEDAAASENSRRRCHRRRFDLKTTTTTTKEEEYLSSPSVSLSNSDHSDELELSYLSAKREADAEHEELMNNNRKKMTDIVVSQRSKMIQASSPTISERNNSVVVQQVGTSEETGTITLKNKNTNLLLLRPPLLSSKRLSVMKTLKDDGRPPILSLGFDVMGHILTFLQPPEILNVLTMPLSKDWRRIFTSQPELWRTLCLVEPFKATIVDGHPSSMLSKKKASISSSKNAERKMTKNEDVNNLNKTSSIEESSNSKHLLDKYRLMYTSFVRCMKYISQIRDDAVHGRPPKYIDYGISGTVAGSSSDHSNNNNNTGVVRAIENGNSSSSSSSSGNTSSVSSTGCGPPPPAALGSNKNLQFFMARARDAVNSRNGNTNSNNRNRNSGDSETKIYARVATAMKKTNRAGRGDSQGGSKNTPKLGRSMITSRLFGPAPGGEPGNTNLPWNCAIYSIVNWMVAFSDVEGIQTLCLKAIPVLLENEQHRLTAQDAGLGDVLMRAMVMFAESAPLHIAAFHAIVLLARPSGGKEGMMFHNSMTADGRMFKGRGINRHHRKSNIAVMLDSMRRFDDNPSLLAMSCWALVNIALVAEQKAVLVKLGGIQAITNAMECHPFSAELQFRALFALINLVIPSGQETDNNDDVNVINVDAAAPHEQRDGEGGEAAATRAPAIEEELGELNETTEREIIDELVENLVSLVVRVMKNFCSSEPILNRACLVLHNSSLTSDYHNILLWTPQCYQMLEWSMANYKTDRVLQQSATGTLQRLQSTLSQNEEMRVRFFASLQSQHNNLTNNRVLEPSRIRSN
jgi:hypothetical protein